LVAFDDGEIEPGVHQSLLSLKPVTPDCRLV
jgi:hypothetical protein